jgi:VWFA-related protein
MSEDLIGSTTGRDLHLWHRIFDTIDEQRPTRRRLMLNPGTSRLVPTNRRPAIFRWSCLALSLIFASGVLAQQRPSAAAGDDTTIRLRVRQVLVPVVVTDKKGRSVNGLRPSDFQIEEDGVAQDIVAFTTEAVATAGAPVASETSASATQNPAAIVTTTTKPKQTWVICFDALHTSVANFIRAKEAMDKFLGSRPRADDQFVLLSIGRQLHVIHTATNDVSAITAKVTSKQFASLALESNSPQLTDAVNDVRRQMDLYCSGCPCGRNAPMGKSTCDLKAERIKLELDARSEQFGTYDDVFFGLLKRVVAELAKLDGRRNLILISDGFTLMPGRELFAVASAYLPNEPYFKANPPRNTQTMLDDSIKLAATHTVIINTIDARGSYSPAARPGGLLDASNAAPGAMGRQEVLASRQTTPALRGGTLLSETDSRWNSVQFDNGGALAQLAKASGGIYFHDNNDLQSGFREVLDDTRETYVIAYIPKNSAQDGKFRKISVTVNDGTNAKRGSLTVRAKSGYWADNAVADQ